MNRNILMDWCENHPVKITHNRVGSFGISLYSNTLESGFFKCYIDWGDDSALEYKEFNTYGTASHTYASAGSKTIIIRGLNPQKVEKFSLGTAATYSELDISALVNITTLSYQYAKDASIFSNGIPRDLLSNYKSLSDVINLFQDFSNVQFNSIPAELFKKNQAIARFSNCFKGMNKLNSIPLDLFRYNTSAWGFNFIFQNCTGLTSLPDDLFRYNELANGFGFTFSGCTGLTSLPDDLFRYNIKALDFNSTFAGCTGLTSLPDELFRYNTLVTSMTMTFHNCTGLTSLPDDIFRYMPLITNMDYCLNGCNNLTALPDDFFLYNLKVKNLNCTLQNTTNLTGSVTLPNAQDCNNLAAFANNSGISNIIFHDNFGANTEVDMTNFISGCPKFVDTLTIPCKVKRITFTNMSVLTPIKTLNLNPNSAFSGVSPQIDITGTIMYGDGYKPTESLYKLAADLPVVTGKTIKIRSAQVSAISFDPTIFTSKGWTILWV